MPAVTVENLLVLPRVTEPGLEAERAVIKRLHRPVRIRGRGVPGSPRVRRRRPGDARPVHSHGPDGRGRVRRGRAEGHAVAPAPRLRDRDVHDRRDHAPPGLQWRRRADHQRRHPVDDRRRRDLAHRGTARGPGGLRRAVPRLPALGQLAPRPEDDRPAVPGHRRPVGRPADVGRRRRAAAADRRLDRRPRRPGRDAHPDHPGPRDRVAGRAGAAAVAGGLQRPGVRTRGVGHRGRREAAGADGSARRVRARIVHHDRR